MHLFTKSSFCLVDQEYWQDLNKDYFVLPKQLNKQIEKVYKVIGRNSQYREKQPFQYPKFYNYESLMAFDCIRKSYISSLKQQKRSRLIYKNLMLSIYIQAKAYHQGCSETLCNYYKKFYNHYKLKNKQLIYQKQFLHTLQSLMEPDQDETTEIDEMIEKEIDNLQETLLSNEKLQCSFEQGMLCRQSKIEKQLIKELNDVFISKIVSMVSYQDQYGFIQEYPHNKKVGVFNFYKVKFQPDFNKYQILIDAQFIEKTIPKQKIQTLIRTKNLQNGKYCHRCRQPNQNPILLCKRRIPLPVPKYNTSTVQCGKAYCNECYSFIQKRVNMQRKEEQEEIEQSQQNKLVCLSCSGQCQCQCCLRDELIGGLYRSMSYEYGSVQKTIPNYYIYYRQKTK